MKRDTIIYLGNFDIININAAGNRVLANGYALRELGYNVVYFGTSGKSNKPVLINNTLETYHGFISYQLPYLKKRMDWLEYNKLFEEFVSVLEENDYKTRVKAIIFYGSPTISLWVEKIVKWCKRNKIMTIEDCVDWLDINNGNFIFRLFKKVDYNYRKKYLNRKMDGVICISSFLENYYKDKNKITVRIPPMTLECNFNNLYNCHKNIIKIVYAGIPFPPGKLKHRKHAKDRLDLAIRYLYSAYGDGIKFKFDIYGITREYYLEALPEDESILNEMNGIIDFHGFKSSEIVEEEISKADFSILIRDINKGTTAGFPTKFVQSVSCGTPVITTDTSDILNYLKESVNGYILDKNEREAIKKLKSILSLPKEEIVRMKEQCMTSKIFSYKKYTNDLRDFIEKLEN